MVEGVSRTTIRIDARAPSLRQTVRVFSNPGSELAILARAMTSLAVIWFANSNCLPECDPAQ